MPQLIYCFQLFSRSALPGLYSLGNDHVQVKDIYVYHLEMLVSAIGISVANDSIFMVSLGSDYDENRGSLGLFWP